MFNFSCLCLLQVAALRSQGKNKLAVEALHAIVTMFQADTASWLELADLHLSLCDYQVRTLSPSFSPFVQ